ncbi:MAG: CocE/NonD family hydrolase C-terminal non-catalytic domain-containing protein, partial [Solirubrobacterales bacterium]
LQVTITEVRPDGKETLVQSGWLRASHRKLDPKAGMSPENGALPQLRAATDPTARGGEFYGPLWGNNGPPVRKPVFRRVGLERAVDKLWEVSERETGIPLDPSAP